MGVVERRRSGLARKRIVGGGDGGGWGRVEAEAEVEDVMVCSMAARREERVVKLRACVAPCGDGDGDGDDGTEPVGC